MLGSKYLVLASSIYEDIQNYKNVKKQENEYKDLNKPGCLSIRSFSERIAKNIINQLKNLSLDEIEIVKSNISEQDWDIVAYIISEYLPAFKESSVYSL